MKIEVFDDNGKLVDTLPANSRRGLSRVEWTMRLKAPRVPPAAVIAGEATVGPRVVPGTYTVKTDARAKKCYTTQVVGHCRRARPNTRWRIAEQEFDAAMRVYNLMGDLSFDVDRINGVRAALLDRASEAG